MILKVTLLPEDFVSLLEALKEIEGQNVRGEQENSEIMSKKRVSELLTQNQVYIHELIIERTAIKGVWYRSKVQTQMRLRAFGQVRIGSPIIFNHCIVGSSPRRVSH